MQNSVHGLGTVFQIYWFWLCYCNLIKFFPELNKPAQRELAGAGISRLGQFTKVSEAEVMQIHGMGPKAMELIRQAHLSSTSRTKVSPLPISNEVSNSS